MGTIYLDNAATTQQYAQVTSIMTKYMNEEFGNASSLYSLGQSSRAAVEETRAIIAESINALPEEIYFTSGGSESDNLAIKGFMDSHRWMGNHIITSNIEHPAVLNTCKFLEKHGCNVTHLYADKFGRIDPAELEESILPSTVMASIMLANNEIGTIQDIKEISRICDEHNIYLHVDAVQAYGQIPIDVKTLKIDMLSASAHKIHGPKGVGFLYIRKPTVISPLIHGGHQENGLRAGTENVPGIVGFGVAAEIATANMEECCEYMTGLRDHMIGRVLNEIPHSRLNGDRKNRLPNNANFSFEGVEGESLLILLDTLGYCVSSGSACMSGQQEPSHVLKAIGLSDELAKGTIRVTLSYNTTKGEVDNMVDALIRCVSDLRGGGGE